MTRVSNAIRRRLDEAEADASRLWMERFAKAVTAEIAALDRPVALAVLEKMREAHDGLAGRPDRGALTVRDACEIAVRAAAKVAPDLAGRIAVQFDFAL